jgi:hypothetical protein
MKKLGLSALVILVFLVQTTGQHLIGISKDYAEETVKKELKGFNLDKSSKNESFNYLKFINAPGTITLIVFFSKDNISTSSKMVCDYSEYDFIKEQYDRDYKKASKTSWEYTVGKDNFRIELEEKEWYFTVTTKKK